MIDRHDAEHEPLLADVMTGELGLDDPAAAPLRACAVCREELRRMAPVTSLLDEAGAEHREILAETVDREAAPPQAHEGARRPWLWATAAALLLVALFVMPPRGCDGGPARGLDDRMLLHGVVDLAGHEPSGETAGDALFPFHWPAATDVVEGSYRVRVFEIRADDTESPEPIAASDWMSATEWTPELAERDRVRRCAAFVWRLEVRDMANAGAQRSRPAIVVVTR